MLAIQEYLETHSLTELSEELAIKVIPHPEFPQLNILNYCQINSPKMHPVVRDCRGIVIDISDNSIAWAGMTRFFNIGEALEITNDFDWSNKINSLSKEDGSLMSLAFNKYSNKWEVKTRGSWAKLTMCENGPKWDELFFSLIPSNFFALASPDFTFIFEMCSMYNQVVRKYPISKLFLLTAIENSTNIETDPIALDIFASGLFERPERIDITNTESAKLYIKQLEQTDGTAEGLVLQDCNGLRIKVKSSTYLAYSRLGGNGNIILTKNIVPLILANEHEEAIAIFPHIKDICNKVEKEIKIHLTRFKMIWATCKDIDDQKEFAMFITKQFTTPFTGILFSLKKSNRIKNITIIELENEFRNNVDLIVKIIEG